MFSVDRFVHQFRLSSPVSSPSSLHQPRHSTDQCILLVPRKSGVSGARLTHQPAVYRNQKSKIRNQELKIGIREIGKSGYWESGIGNRKAEIGKAILGRRHQEAETRSRDLGIQKSGSTSRDSDIREFRIRNQKPEFRECEMRSEK